MFNEEAMQALRDARDGKDLVRYKSLDELLEDLEDRRDIALARAGLADIERNGSVPWDEVKARTRLCACSKPGCTGVETVLQKPRAK